MAQRGGGGGREEGSPAWLPVDSREAAALGEQGVRLSLRATWNEGPVTVLSSVR